MFKNTGGSRNTRGTDTRISEDKQPQNRDHTMRLTVRCSNHCYALRVTAAVSTGDSACEHPGLAVTVLVRR